MAFAPLLGLGRNPQKNRGSIHVHMLGATKEQSDAVIAWLLAEAGPVAMLPSTSS